MDARVLLAGLSREFFFHISNEMLNPMYCLFKYSDAGNYALEINKDSSINPEHLVYFRFVGRLVALAIYHGFFIDNGFTVPLYKQLLDKSLTLKDVGVKSGNPFQSRICSRPLMDCFANLEDGGGATKLPICVPYRTDAVACCSRISADVRSSDDVIAIKVDAVDPEFHTSLKWILDNSIVRSCTRRPCHAGFGGA